jgi:16S rRNA (cytidine1402-2'-O)-methyltransferase
MPRAEAPQDGAAAPAGGTGKLYVVATPIGNLGDITLRALDVLRAVRLIAAEDTRHTRKLLAHYEIRARLTSYREHNRAARLPVLLSELDRGDVALVSDAGTPLISDPGQELVAAAAAAGHEVVAIPGPSSLSAALSVAGLDVAPSHFLGFLPRRPGPRQQVLRAARSWPGALVIFEAPHRLLAVLGDLLEVLGDRRLAVCSDLTKLHEQVQRSTIGEALQAAERIPPRGEFTLVVAGASETRPLSAEAPDPTQLQARFEALQQGHSSRSRALSALAAETGTPRKALYELLVTRRGTR